MPGQIRRGGRRGEPRASQRAGFRRQRPQQSTGFVRLSQKWRNLARSKDVFPSGCTNERVSCIFRRARMRAACPSAFLSARLMWSKAAAAAMGNCGCSHAMSCCRAASASISTATLAAQLLPARAVVPGNAVKVRSKARKSAGRTEPKKLLPVQEPHGGMAVDDQMPGEAPQPLTLNHPASNPGRFSGRGSSF